MSQHFNYDKRKLIIDLLKQQVKPAVGYTEIGIVSLAAAKASSMLTGNFKSAICKISPYIFRNDIFVGVPSLGICGLNGIIAAGIVLKNPDKLLTLLEDINKTNKNKILKLIKSNLVLFQ